MHAIYARVSTEEQARSGYSLADQLRTCRAKLAAMGAREDEITDYVDDGYSGEFMERPALEKLREDIRSGAVSGYIAILDPDRLSRNLTDTLLLADEFEKSAARLVFVTAQYDSSPEGKLFFSIRGAVAAFEKAKTRERSMRGKKEKALAGKIVIPRPKYGYDLINGVYAVNQAEAERIREIYSMCVDEKRSLHAIARSLNERGLRNKHGRPFNFKYIYKILRDESYAGTYYEMRSSWKKIGQNKYEIRNNEKKDWIPIPIPPIISLEDQIRAKSQLSDNAAFSRRNQRIGYMLTGMIKCGICGKGMTAVSYKRGANLLKYYICYGKRVLKTCPDSAYVNVDEIEKAVWEFMLAIAKNAEHSPISPDARDKTLEINEHESALLSLKKRKDHITNLVLEDLIEPGKAEKKLRQIAFEIAAQKSQIAELKAAQARLRAATLETSGFTAADTVEKRRELLRGLGVVVTVYKKKNQPTQFEMSMD